MIYGLGASYDGDIRTRDLTTDTPYNTYTRAGLPPTPIALPGRDPFWRAVKPQENGRNLFSWRRATGDGGTPFLEDAEEHNAAVKSYLAHLRLPSSAGARHERPDADGSAWRLLQSQ